MNEKLSDYIGNIIKTIRSQSRIIHNAHPLSKMRLINFYRFKLSNNKYMRNLSLYYYNNNRYKISIMRSLKYYSLGEQNE